VARPGRYPLAGQSADVALGLVDVLAMAGGATAEAGSNVTVFRRSGGDEERIEVDINSLMGGQALSNAGMALSEGDVVIVPKGQVFYVYGQVQHPGRYPLTPNLLVMQAISISGGVTERGSERDVTVTRKSGKGHAAKDIKLDDVLEPGDVIYVKERFF
jgi:polysaccharide export outer membrane protein